MSLLFCLLFHYYLVTAAKGFVLHDNQHDRRSNAGAGPLHIHEASGSTAPTTFTSPSSESLSAPLSSSSSPLSSSTCRRLEHRENHDSQAWIQGWSSVQSEECYSLHSTTGDFPNDLLGTFYQNGPGLFEIGQEKIMHPFDGDGMVRAVTFDGLGRAWFRNRFVNTKKYRQEQDAGRILYRGVFGTAKNRGAWWSNLLDLRTKNVANTHVLFHLNRLYALWDAGRPMELDPITLQTKVEESWRFGDRYAAHYKVDPQTNTLCNFAIYFGKPDPTKTHKLTVMEHHYNGPSKKSSGGRYEKQDELLLYRDSYTLPGLAIGHDMAITENWFVFFRSPCSFDPVPFLLGTKGPAQCFQWNGDRSDTGAPTMSQLHLIPRQHQSQKPHQEHRRPISLDIPPCFCFHVCNAYEEARSNNEATMIVVDVVLADRMFMAQTNSSKYPDKPITETIQWSDFPSYQLVRFRVNLNTHRVISQTTLSVIHDKTENSDAIVSAAAAAATVDFPVIHPRAVGRPYQYAYLLACASPTTMGPIQGLIKVDVQLGCVVEKWLPPTLHEYLTEVVVVPRGQKQPGQEEEEEEDNAYLMGYLVNGKDQTTDLVIFDATRISQGPISRARLKHMMPHSLHGTWVPGFAPALTDRVRSSFVQQD